VTLLTCSACQEAQQAEEYDFGHLFFGWLDCWERGALSAIWLPLATVGEYESGSQRFGDARSRWF